MVSTASALQEKKYRWAGWAILLNLIIILVLISGVLMFGLVAWSFAADLFEAQAITFGMISIICFAPILFVLAILILPVFIQVVGGILFSYLKVTPIGMEYRKWPNYGLRCKWEDVERRGTYHIFGLIPGDVLYLKNAEPVGWQLTMSLRRRLGLPQQLVISLTGIQGWPNGQLAEQLKNYIPDIMADHPQG